MDHINVDSSIIRSVGYDETSQALEITFREKTYRYTGVPRATYEALAAAPSVGKYFHAHIKGRYSYTEV